MITTEYPTPTITPLKNEWQKGKLKGNVMDCKGNPNTGKACKRNAKDGLEYCGQHYKMWLKLQAQEEPWTMAMPKQRFVMHIINSCEIGKSVAELMEMSQSELTDVYAKSDAKGKPATPKPTPQQEEQTAQIAIEKQKEYSTQEALLSTWDDDTSIKQDLKLARRGRISYMVKPKNPRSIWRRYITKVRIENGVTTMLVKNGPKWQWKA